jgi:BASS family bile acid:Na+ symporter
VATGIDSVLAVIGSGAILAGLCFVLLAGVAGFTFAPRDPDVRRTLALATAARNVAAAFITAGHSFADQPGVLIMVVVTSVISVLVLFPAARLMRSGHASRQSVDHI